MTRPLPAELRRTTMDRFVDKVVVWADGCWTWAGAKNPNGYAKFWYDGRLGDAHRFAYQLFRGPVPGGLHVDHLCRVRCCVNPAHLEAVTPRENLMRGTGASARNAAKTTCRRGHSYDEANTQRNALGWRRCRACARERNQTLMERDAYLSATT